MIFHPAVAGFEMTSSTVVVLKYNEVTFRVEKVNEERVAGRYEVNFKTSSISSGLYLYRLKVNDFVDLKKMILLK